MMTDALKPCPFCGEDASIGRGPRGWFVNCQDCLASTNQLMNEPETEAEAIAAWNARAAPLVKPLVWDRMPRGMCHVAKTGFGRYSVERNYGGWAMWTPEQTDDAEPLKCFTSEETARAAAQADYTARILAALEAPQQNTDGGLAGGLAEAPNCHDVENNRKSEE